MNPPRYYDTESSMHTAITISRFHCSHQCALSLVDSEELLNEMDRKCQLPHQKEVSQVISKICKSFRGMNSIIVEQSHNH